MYRSIWFRLWLAGWLFILPGAQAREVPLTILYTTDVHGHILADESSSTGAAAGLLKCATLIQQVRDRERNVLLFDCGDLIQGSAESWLTQGGIMLRAVEWLGYDGWVFGNHDFDWGIKPLAALQDKARIPMLAANLDIKPGADNPLYKVKPFVFKDVDGVRVAVVGLTTPAISTWLRPEMLGDVRFRRSVDALSRIMPAVRAVRPDVLILLVHQGYQEPGDDAANEVQRIARSFPEFDLMLGGHLHRPQSQVLLNGVLFSQAGYHGNWLGRADLVYDTVKKRVVTKNADVLPVDPTTKELEPLRALLKDDLDKTRLWLDEVIGSTELDLTASEKLPAQSPVQQLICAAMARAVNADIVLHGLLTDATISAGPIKRGDVWRIVPYENKIGIVELTLPELREILEENTELGGANHFSGVYGLSYELHPKAPRGHRIVNLAMADGTHPHARKRFRVATSSFVLASGGGRLPILRQIAEKPTSRLEMTGVDTRAAVMKYIQQKSPLRLEAGKEVTVVWREPVD